MPAVRQFTRFLFLRVAPEWRRLPDAQQRADKAELVEAVRQFQARLMLRSYSLVGTRGDAELLLWQVADDVEAFQGLQTALLSTRLGAYFGIAHSYLGMARRSIYQFPHLGDGEERVSFRPQDTRYLFVYPFVKTREWYRCPLEQRQEMMDEHVAIGRKYPGIRINTVYSFGLDDQEFLLAFEGDDPGEFVALVMELRESRASAFTLVDTPIFTCIQMALWDTLDALGGSPGAAAAAIEARDQDGFTPVARVADIAVGTAKRVYCGGDAIALFNVGGEIYAVSDRCTHGRASLSEGCVEPGTGVLQCPWHGGRFELATGRPVSAPAQVPLKTYRVRIDDGQILVG